MGLNASRGLLYFPCYSMTTYGRHAFSYAGPHAWNLLLESVRNSILQTLSKDIFIQADYALSALETIHFSFNGLYKCTS